MNDSDKALVVFQGRKIRRTWFNDEWWFSVVDIVGALTQTDRVRKYWSDLKTKLQDEGFEVSEKIGQLKLVAEDGKLRLTDCANTKNMFRIIQSVPSPNAEPFKQWLAQVGYDRVQEIENPELAQQRMKETYKAKGYSDEWIEKRIRGIAVRDELTDEWKKRGVLGSACAGWQDNRACKIQGSSPLARPPYVDRFQFEAHEAIKLSNTRVPGAVG